MWEWLGDHLAIDFANTVKRRGRDYEDLLVRAADVAEWIRRRRALEARGAAEPAGSAGGLPAIGEAAVAPHLDDVRALRDDVFAALAAAANDEPAPRGAAGRLNERLRRHPVVPLLGEPAHVAGDPDPLDELLARIAAATVQLISDRGADLALCDAPSCGQFFLRARGNQRWCGPACGNRARVARHAHAA